MRVLITREFHAEYVGAGATIGLLRGSWSRIAPRLLLGGVAALVVIFLAPGLYSTPISTVHHVGLAARPLTSPAAATLSTAPPASALQLGIGVQPQAICAYGLATCSAGNGLGRVTLTANAGSGGVLSWPDVQVAFVVETTLFDGVYDAGAGEPGTSCASGGNGMPCEESNGVPFFVAHAQQIANAISSANPHSHVSFAMVDYFATCNLDDCDGSEYHVDIPQFITSGQFGSAVISTFQAEVLLGGWYYSDSDFSDNILHSSVITALYGTIIGSGLDWSNNTHHVIVWMGSTAPRDPNYVQNYAVSPSTFAGFGSTYSASCEPSYQFATGSSPNCEGWVRSQDGNQTHSIAQLAKTAKQCTESIGGVCTIDAIDLYDTATDYLSRDWPAVRAGSPASALASIRQNVERVIQAGCDIASATGGTWDGPSWATCPDGQTGSLQPIFNKNYQSPSVENPSLFNAFRLVGFGPVLQTQVAAGTNRPLFEWVPFGNIQLPTDHSLIQPTAGCQREGAPFKDCNQTVTILHFGPMTYLGWNWSVYRSDNIMYVGDAWTASFNVVATGPPFTTVPVDACVTVECHAGGSTSVSGMYTRATFIPYTNTSWVNESFPLGTVTVLFTTASPVGPAAPPPLPPPPPPFAIAQAPPLPVSQPVGVANNVGVANVSVQATAAGVIAAGFLRVSVRNRPLAMRIAAKSGIPTSRFDSEAMKKTPELGHFE